MGKHKEMKIYLDDIRKEPDGWTRTYTVEETIDALITGKVTHLSLDNDLGEGLLEGYKVLDYLEELVHYNPEFPIPDITIHSSNGVRVKYMQTIIEKLGK